MILRTAADQDLKTLIAWIKDKGACQQWAGPDVRFPLTLHRLKHDIGYSKDNTFALQNASGELVGLGQLLLKENHRIHLARIIVSPLQRGRSFGKLLCRLLIDEGIKRFGQVYFTLNVYAANQTAVNLYQQLGFKPTAAPADLSLGEEIIPMVLNPDQAKKLEAV